MEMAAMMSSIPEEGASKESKHCGSSIAGVKWYLKKEMYLSMIRVRDGTAASKEEDRLQMYTSTRPKCSVKMVN